MYFRFEKPKLFFKLESPFLGVILWKKTLPSNDFKSTLSQSSSPEMMPYVTFSCWVRMGL